MNTGSNYFKILILLFILLNANNGFCQLRPAIAWQKSLGGTANESANDVLITNDNKILVVGFSTSNDGDVTGHHGSNTVNDGWIVKLDTSGNIIWQRSVGGTGADHFSSVIATTDNAYLCIGTTYSNDGDVTGYHGNGDVWVVKISTDGNIIWSKCYGGSKYDYGSDITISSDGNYAFIGTSFSYDGDVLSGINGRIDPDGWAVKTDPSGNIIWEKCLNFITTLLKPWPRKDIGYCITPSETGNLYAVATGTKDYQAGGFPFYDTVVQNPGKLYELNNNDGNSTLIGSIGGDSCFSMFKAPGKTYFSYTSRDYNSTQHCWSESFHISTRLDGSSIFTDTYLYSASGTCGIPNIDQLYFGTPNGTAEEPSLGLIMGAGYQLGFTNHPATLNIGVKKYLYGSVSGSSPVSTAFTSVKVFPTGNEYIAAGYAYGQGDEVASTRGGLDIWLVKLQALNKIVGNVFADDNNNGIQDGAELPFNEAIVKTTKQGFELSAIPANGIYRNVVDTGTFTTVLNINRPYYTATPASKTSIFTTYKNTDTANFAVHPIPGIKDYTLGMVSLLTPRPGFNLQYKISYFNMGTTTLTNKLVTFVKDSRTQFLGAVPVNTSINGDTIKWNISTLAPWTGGEIIVNLQMAVPPTVNIGDIIINKALIDSAGDYHPVDNYVVLNQVVTGSYDPNDKKESFAGEIYPPDIAAGKYLNYNIRFQNTGNDTAFNIILRDTLDSKLNADSIEVVDASHSYSINIKDKKYLTVLFNNIKLADSVHNEPLSHGYFSYRIKPAASLALGDTIRNSASIYFDFNLPIKTNTEITIYKPTPSTNLWTGAVSSAWEDPLNWGNHLVPDENTNVIINTGLPRYPIINSAAVCRTMQVKTGTTVLVKDGFTLKVTH